MDFIVETITPDFFYYNLLLGLPKILDKLKHRGIKKKHLVRFEPASNEQVAEWETTNQVNLPLDLTDFYKSTNGFLYQWICSFGKKLLVMGKISVYPLQNLKEVTNYQLWTTPEFGIKGSEHYLKLSSCSKVFELCNIEDDYKICLVYLYQDGPTSVWLYTKSRQFYYLAKTFTEYFRMCIVHLGIPHWQLAYTPMGLPEWVKILMRLICPAILNAGKHKRSVQMITDERITSSTHKYFSAPINVLDTAVFEDHYHPKRYGPDSRSHGNTEIFLLKAPSKKKTKMKSGKATNKYGTNSTRSKVKTKKV